MHKIFNLFIFILFFSIVIGCATTSSVQNAPLHAGVARTYEADFDRTLKAAREALVEAGLQIENVNQVDNDNWMILGKKGTSAWSWGELARVVVTRDNPTATTVRVYTQRKSAVNIAAKGDYSNSILSNIELKLK